MLTDGEVGLRYEVVDFDGHIDYIQAGNGVYFVDEKFLPVFLKTIAA